MTINVFVKMVGRCLFLVGDVIKRERNSRIRLCAVLAGRNSKLGWGRDRIVSWKSLPTGGPQRYFSLGFDASFATLWKPAKKLTLSLKREKGERRNSLERKKRRELHKRNISRERRINKRWNRWQLLWLCEISKFSNPATIRESLSGSCFYRVKYCVMWAAW